MNEFREAIRNHKDGAIISLFVTSGADRAIFPAGYNVWRKRLDIKVRSEAKENKANKDVIKTVAEYFNKSVANVYIISGEKSREKILLVKGISVDNAIKRLKESLNGL